MLTGAYAVVGLAGGALVVWTLGGRRRKSRDSAQGASQEQYVRCSPGVCVNRQRYTAMLGRWIEVNRGPLWDRDYRAASRLSFHDAARETEELIASAFEDFVRARRAYFVLTAIVWLLGVALFVAVETQLTDGIEWTPWVAVAIPLVMWFFWAGPRGRAATFMRLLPVLLPALDSAYLACVSLEPAERADQLSEAAREFPLFAGCAAAMTSFRSLTDSSAA